MMRSMTSPARSHDVFVSYNSKDRPIVSQIAEYFRRAKLRVFYDEQGVGTGERWIKTLKEAMLSSRSCVVFYGPHGYGPVQEREAEWAETLDIYDASFGLFTALLPGAVAPDPIWASRHCATIQSQSDKGNFQKLVDAINALPKGTTQPPASILSWIENYKNATIRHNPTNLRWFQPLDVEIPKKFEESQRFKSLKKVVQNTDNTILLVGEPGAGKTTLLEHLRHELCSELNEYDDSPIPVLMRLNTYQSPTGADNIDSFYQWLCASWEKQKEIYNIQAPSLPNLLTGHRLWLFLDALNEMDYRSDKPSARFTDITHFVRRYPNIRVIVSCRTQDVEGRLESVRAKVLPMDVDDMRNYLKSACQSKGLSEVAANKIFGCIRRCR